MIRTVFRLTGAQAGRTAVLGGKYKFVRGVFRLSASLADTIQIAEFLKRNWQAEAFNEESEIESGVPPTGEVATSDEAEKQPEPTRSEGQNTAGARPDTARAGQAQSLKDTIQNLEKKHFTKDGKPSVRELTKRMGRKVLRHEVDAVWP
jgi:hypothetical protein